MTDCVCEWCGKVAVFKAGLQHQQRFFGPTICSHDVKTGYVSSMKHEAAGMV